MKKITSTAIFVTLLTIYSHATIITVDNRAGNPANYSDFTSAISAASAGDTILMKGSDQTYGSITINKKIVVIGSGYNPSYGASCKVSSIDLENNSSGTVIQGLKVTSELNTRNATSAISNIRIERCEVSSIYFGSGQNDNTWLIVNNILKGPISGSSSSYSDIIIRNNIITYSTSGIVFRSYSSNDILENNIILMAFGFSSASILSSSVSPIVRNNIFLGDGISFSCSSCRLSNNIFESFSESWTNSPSGFSPQIENDLLFNMYSGETFIYEDDFRLQDLSPAKTAGPNGEEIGVYGGVAPFPIGGEAPFITSVGPNLPAVTSLEILTPDVAKDGNLSIRLKAETSN